MLREPTAGNGKQNHGTAAKNIARQPGSRPRKKQARVGNQAGTTRKDRKEVEVLRGSLHGVARALTLNLYSLL